MKIVTATAGAALLTIIAIFSPADAATWKTISSEESPLYFAVDIPQVIEDGGWNAQYSRRIYRIASIPKSGQDARAVLYLSRLAPNYFFQTVQDARSALALFKYFKKDHTILQDQRTAVTGDFRTSYLIAEAQGRACVVFSGKTGQGGGDAQYSEGTSILTGYYCQPVGDDLTDEALTVVLDAIGTKTEGTVAPASAPAPFEE
tara:strand:- start:87 stop:695 length:609 start_codon:yes stop_codon:yes gene_type:complete